MKILKKSPLLLLGTAFLASSFSTLSAVETEPVGYVTVNVNPTADTRIGVPLIRVPSFAGKVASVSSGVVTVASATTLPDVKTSTHFLWVNSGALLGKWYTVTDYNGNTLTVAENLETAGLSSDDSFSIVPFWTLDTLLPGGGGLPKSSNIIDPIAQLMFNNVAAVGINLVPESFYFYYNGTQGLPEGWYDANDLAGGVIGASVIVSPETYISVRSYSTSPASLTFFGAVPVHEFANEVVSRSAGYQDNQIVNPFPAGVTYANSNLVTSGAIRPSSDIINPLDQLLLFAPISTSYNSTPEKFVFYYDGTQGLPEGWYDVNNLGGGLINDEEIPAGAPMIIRRATGSDEVFSWAPGVPYSL